MLTWLGHAVPWYLVKHSGCVYEGDELAFKSVDWAKQIALLTVRGYHRIDWEAWLEHRMERKEISLSLPDSLSGDRGPLLPSPWDQHLRTPVLFSERWTWTGTTSLAFLGLQLTDSTSQGFWIPYISWHIHIYVHIYAYIYTHTVFFLWRALIQFPNNISNSPMLALDSSPMRSMYKTH